LKICSIETLHQVEIRNTGQNIPLFRRAVKKSSESRIVAFEAFSDHIATEVLVRLPPFPELSRFKGLTISFNMLTVRAAKSFLPLLALSSVLSGCAGLGLLVKSPGPVQKLHDGLDAVLTDSIFVPTQTSIKVVSLDSKEVLYERNSRLLMRPASNMKLLTASAALRVLGTNHEFETEVLRDTSMSDGVLRGNLYLKGYGDPILQTSDLDTLVQQIKASGITAVQGSVVADVSYFDDLPWGSGWMWDDEPYDYDAMISPLTINDNCVHVKVAPGLRAGDSAIVSIDPTTTYVLLLNTAKTVMDTVVQPLEVSRLFKERSNTIVVKGEILATSAPVEVDVSVWRPELYAAQLLTEALKRDSVEVENQPTAGVAPSFGDVVARGEHGLDSALVHMDKVSDNLTAELLLKSLGVAKSGTPGTSQGGTYVVRDFLSSIGIDTTRILSVDGSGLSFYNLLTAEAITQLLESMSRQEDVFPLFYTSLPIAGIDGTLRNRMKGTPAEGNVRAKTGTISGASSLSGYVTTADGERLAFSMLMQNFIYPTRLYQRAQDRIAALLASFSRNGRVTQR
jgi:D-alanyl-D-alanine carboxypeptidase/D-alanyl-D-alanine-endopeptidase (penicillin-binding protein 4)